MLMLMFLYFQKFPSDASVVFSCHAKLNIFKVFIACPVKTHILVQNCADMEMVEYFFFQALWIVL